MATLQHIRRAILPRISCIRCTRLSSSRAVVAVGIDGPLIPAPRPNDGPLMERRPDRELPDLPPRFGVWARTVPIFLLVLGASTLAIFNYQKSSSPVIASTMYALRTSNKAREILGDEIEFAHKIPWIWGTMNQLHGRIDITFEVKGLKQQATMRFTSRRPTRRGVFITDEWSLTRKDGSQVDLLEQGESFQMLDLEEYEKAQKVPGRGLYAPSVDR